MIKGNLFHRACSRGNLEEVKRLLANGANIHFSNDCGLRWAVCNERLEVVKFLLANGANINANENEVLRFLHSKSNEMKLIINNHLLLQKLVCL
jgi:ankyrin repeat protein